MRLEIRDVPALVPAAGFPIGSRHSRTRTPQPTSLGHVGTALAPSSLLKLLQFNDQAPRSAGLALYLVYLLLEKALVGWVTILLELAVGVVLMGVKLYLDLYPGWAPALLGAAALRSRTAPIPACSVHMRTVSSAALVSAAGL